MNNQLLPHRAKDCDCEIAVFKFCLILSGTTHCEHQVGKIFENRLRLQVPMNIIFDMKLCSARDVNLKH